MPSRPPDSSPPSTTNAAAPDAEAERRAVREALREAEAGVTPRHADAASAAAALARRLDHLRETVGGYVRARRAAGAPATQVVAEVRHLVGVATADERWADPDGSLAAFAVRAALAAYPAPPGAGGHGDPAAPGPLPPTALS